MAIEIVREIEPQFPQKRRKSFGDPKKPCGWCKRPKTAHTEHCPYRASGSGRPTGGKVARAKSKRGGKRKTTARRAPRALARLDSAEAVKGHRSSAALAIAHERAEEELQDARARAIDAQAEVRALERLVARLAGGS